MKAKADILDLGERFGIEAPHTEHVGRLALALFDGFFPLDGFRKEDRNLLFAAASLHDIAYAIDPENHVIEGGRVLFENPVDGFSSDEWLSIIGIAMLHKRDWRAMLAHELFPKVGEKDLVRIKKLAAMLRIADGLDHGHIQDARIVNCKRGRKFDKIEVVCQWYAGNVPWAEGKADLWETVFKRGLRIKGALKKGGDMFKGVVCKKDTALSAARRLLYSQWCIMRDNVPGMLEASSLDCLHDYRVAMRRFRAALRMFRPLLEETNARLLDDRVGELSDRLGPVRDAHVALQLFQSLEPASDRNPQLIASLQEKVEEANVVLRNVLESDFCLQTVQLANRFLRVDLPTLERETTESLFVDYAESRLAPLLEKIVGQDVAGLREGAPEHLHEFRKLCRRGRYYAEFAAPVLGKDAQRAAKHLKTIAGALGDVRDARALIDRFSDDEVASAITERERAAWKHFSSGWRKLTGD